MSSTLLFVAGLLYVGVAVGFARNGYGFEAGAWFCYSLANACFALRALQQGN